LGEVGQKRKEYYLTLPGRFGVVECLWRINNQGTMGEVRDFVPIKVPGKKVVSLKYIVSS
jgi:hypothetical protein